MGLAILVCIVFTGLVIAIINAVEKSNYENNMMELEKKKIEDAREKNEKFMEENNIPQNANIICRTNIIVQDVPIEGKFDVFLWKENNILNICGSSVRKTEIPTENVKYYTRTGDCMVGTITEGGGVNIGNAILGGIVGAIIGAILMGTMGMIVAFGIGALLAGRNKTITKNKEIDDRKTYLYYSEDNKDKQMVFTSKAYEELLELIPEKEMSYIENSKILEMNKSQNDNKYDDIERLSGLRDKGILTDDEFNIKKQLLLDKIQ